MSDIDRLLTDAGEAWRAEQPPAPEPMLNPRRPGRVLPVLAAAAVVLLVVAAVLIVRAAADRRHNPPAIGPAGLILRDGDTAEASGLVLAIRGQPVQFCPGAAIAGVGGQPELPACGPHRITAVGVKLDRLSDRQVSRGTTFGRTMLRGTYRHGALLVTAQGAPVAPPPEQPPGFFTKTPCAPPSGGWKGSPPTDPITAYVGGFPERFNGVGVNYPVKNNPSISVVVVGVFKGDLAKAQAELRASLGPNICTVRVQYSLTEQLAAQHAVEQLATDPANGIYQASGVGNFRAIGVSVVLLTQARYDQLAKIGFHELDLDVWLKPAP